MEHQPQWTLQEIEQHLVEARKMERVAREREERALEREAEDGSGMRRPVQGSKIYLPGSWLRQDIALERAAEEQETERRISRILAETLESARVWELSTSEAEERKEM